MLISNIINTEQTARTNIILSSLLRTTRTMYFHTKYNGTQVHKLILNEPCTMENICNSIFKSGTLMCVCTLTWCACRFCFRIINYYANQPFIQIESIRNRILIPVRQVLLFLAPSSSCFLHLFSMFKSPPSASDWINQSINQQTNHQTTIVGETALFQSCPSLLSSILYFLFNIFFLCSKPPLSACDPTNDQSTLIAFPNNSVPCRALIASCASDFSWYSTSA